MLKTIITIASLIIIPSAALAADEPPILQQHKQAQAMEPAIAKPVESARLQPVVPAPINPSEIYIYKKNAPLGKKSRKAVRLANAWINKPVLPTVEGKDGNVVYTFGATMPVLVCRPLRVCVLQLEQGETIIDPPRCGDTAQWEISPSKPDTRRPPHIYIKPLDSGLTTDLIIVTDRRTYVIALKSRNDSYTPLVSFRYPENEERAWAKALADQARLEEQNKQNNRFRSGSMSFNAEDLDFNYSIDGDAKWRPLRVFNNGVKTYLKMPKIMKMYEAPVLLTINDGKEAIVNYRLHDDLFIVDQLFDSAVLLSGVGSHQTKITITHDSDTPGRQ